MRHSFHLVAAAALLAASLAVSPAAFAAEGAQYEPAPGQEVVVYTHRFNAKDFDAGLKLIVEGMAAAQRDAKQIRKNEILVDRKDYRVVLISYFSPDSDVEAWHSFEGRLKLLEKLKPLWREPQTVEAYKLEAITRAP